MNKITLSQFLKASNYNIQDGSEYLWTSYGKNVRSIDCGNFTQWSSDYWQSSVIFDTKTQFVYEVKVFDEGPKKAAYRWIAPDYVKKNKAEHKRRGFRFEDACGIDFIDLTAKEMLATIESVMKKHNRKKRS